MLVRKLEQYIRKRRCTVLGVGPMSKNCVDAAVELANEWNVPILLVASRRQIEAQQLGGGYVNNWTTESLAQYVIDRDESGNVILCRDHGGPWQNTFEIDQKLSFRHAMESAKQSFEADIKAGFEIIHIDPSIDIFEEVSTDEVLGRVFELYEFCWSAAQRLDRKISFEIGTEEQNGSVQNLEQLEYVISQTEKFCKKNKFSKPLFVVAQVGTKVMETQNVGALDSPFRVDGELPAEIQVPRTIEMCDHYDIYLKEHNADYMSDEALRWHPKLGIHAVNVAPEFGVVESTALINALRQHKLSALADRFLQVAVDSRKWEKWMRPGSKLSLEQKGLIAGHYVFADPQVAEIKKEAQRALTKKNIELGMVLKDAVKQAILRYLRNFNLLRRKI